MILKEVPQKVIINKNKVCYNCLKKNIERNGGVTMGTASSRFVAVMVAAVVILFAGSVFGQECIECHRKVTPNIVSDWELSKHSQNGVGCAACHGDLHKSAEDASKAKRPLPDTCAPCHEKQVEQFRKGKHALAWEAQWAIPRACRGGPGAAAAGSR
jgi:hypothetical protein